MRVTIAYFLGAHEDWGGASRALTGSRQVDDKTNNSSGIDGFVTTSLADMTTKALDLLDDDGPWAGHGRDFPQRKSRGFFLQVEGASIDKQHDDRTIVVLFI